MKKLTNVNNVKEIANKLKNEKSVAVICHIHPDGDAIGSAVALSLGLNTLGIKTAVFCDDVVPKKFSYLQAEKYVNREFIGEFSAIVAVDCGDENRLGAFSEAFCKSKNTYNIDHHVSNPRYAKVNYVVERASNAENVYEILKEMGVEINKEIATFLLMGVMTDTGGFRHKSVEKQTFFCAGELVEKGADVNQIYYNCFAKQTKERAKLFALVMGRLRYLLDGKYVIATVFQEDLLKTGALYEDSEGFIDFLMGIDSVEVASCIMQTGENKYKISFRAKDTDVNAVASTFGGGGHKLASGCQISGEYEEVIDKIRYAVKVHIKE